MRLGIFLCFDLVTRCNGMYNELRVALGAGVIKADGAILAAPRIPQRSAPSTFATTGGLPACQVTKQFHH